jgi:hypothetical protein
MMGNSPLVNTDGGKRVVRVFILMPESKRKQTLDYNVLVFCFAWEGFESA